MRKVLLATSFAMLVTATPRWLCSAASRPRRPTRGVHSTGNDSGEQCTANNPCEVAADGTVTVRKGAR
ncbi:hypothetical protein ACFOWZ_45345 [Lentzea rhizosphaerae]|uniref:Uncharacterized protein n=1 Tax=Lentzea rhizosphaerae TaxID=2041025 RepID=A0ABV8C9D1_9PSEU